LKQDCWSGDLLRTAIGLVQDALTADSTSSADACAS